MASARKKSTAKKASARAGKPAANGNPKMDWLIAFMKKKPSAVYADASEAAKAAGIDIYPIMWGRAQVMLGRIKQKPRGQGKASMARVAKDSGAAPVKRGPGRPRKTEAGPAPVKRGPGRPRKTEATVAKRGPGRPRKVTATQGLSIPIANNDLATMQQLVDAVNGGAKVSLRYDGGNWALAIG